MNKAMAKLAVISGMMAGLTGGNLPYGMSYKEPKAPKAKTGEGKFIVKFNRGYYKLTVDGVKDVLRADATIFYSYDDAKSVASKYGAKVVKIG